ncbi:unnamed protein product [Rangifer tarandus platyrhynchus]|uniref:Uncharacterized protein n=2 Tax=Rangifer tarandus platyrhynchus TaxID=3082113 RepID=A0ABN8Z1J6_RANTA|nr:unnamed protein product [Rangifer tarandus platyrhynchus]
MLKCIIDIYHDELWDSIVSGCSDKCCTMIYHQTLLFLKKKVAICGLNEQETAIFLPISYILTNSCNVPILFSKLVLTPVGVSVKQVCIGKIYFLIKKKRKHSCYYNTFLAELEEGQTNHAVHWRTLRLFSGPFYR